MDISELRGLIASAPPEIQRSFVALNSWVESDCAECKEKETLTAAPHRNPVQDTVTEMMNAESDPFSPPTFNGPTPLTVTADGRLMGHLASWNSCHIGNPDGQGVCTPPPHSKADYSYFKTGVFDYDGRQIPVGIITMNANHAPLSADITATAARDHYAHTATQAAYVNIGEDDHGIWVSGVLNPDLSPSDIRALKAAAISGDWRVIDNNRELIAALAVNVPGFPIPRPQALVASGEITALVAANIVPQPEPWMEVIEQVRADFTKLADTFAPLVASAIKAQVPNYSQDELQQRRLVAEAIKLQATHYTGTI